MFEQTTSSALCECQASLVTWDSVYLAVPVGFSTLTLFSGVTRFPLRDRSPAQECLAKEGYELIHMCIFRACTAQQHPRRCGHSEGDSRPRQPPRAIPQKLQDKT